MKRYVMRYAEENYGLISFDAKNKKEAEDFKFKLEMGDIEIDMLPNYSSTVKTASYMLLDLEEAEVRLPPIPIRHLNAFGE